MKNKITCLLLSLMLVITLIPQISFATETAGDEEGTKVITGFAPLETSDYYYEGNPDEGELTLNLPDTLNVYLDNSDNTTAINVSWEAVEDFDHTDFYFYSMQPVWGDEYKISADLSEILDVPWITVYKQEADNKEIEPITSEEDIEPVYTEEEGPIDPEATSLSDIADGTAKTILNLVSTESYADSVTNADAIYTYLTQAMGLNTAAACGVMVNIYAESAMLPNNLQNSYNSSLKLSDEEYTKRVDNGSSGAYKTGSGTSKNFKTDSAGYGLCQWTSSGRKGNLLNATKGIGKSVGDLNSQMAFLEKELNSYPHVLATLNNVPNTAGGAYIAAAHFCLSFEIPANTVATAASRGKTCLDGFWKQYSSSSENVTGNSFASICGYTYPTAVKKGKGLSVSGYAVSNYKIATVSAKIATSGGTTKYSKTVRPNDTTYALSKLDSYMEFSKLSSGTYTYTIAIKDTLGKTVKASHTFKVSSSASSIKRGFVTNSGVETTSPVVSVKKAYPGPFPKLPKRGYFKKGDKGTQVKYLQRYLKWYGYSISSGGTYGTKTVVTVKKFQKTMKLKQDGKFGKKTLAKAKAVKK